MPVLEHLRLQREAQIRRFAFPDDEARQAWLPPFYGVTKSAERARLIESGEVHRLAKVLQEYDWPKLAERMQVFDHRRPPE